MARKRYKPEEIVAKLRQVDVLVSQGQNMVDAIRQIGVSEVTYYRWRQEFGGLKTEHSALQPPSGRVWVGGRFCHSKFFAALMAHSITRSEFMREKRTCEGCRSIACHTKIRSNANAVVHQSFGGTSGLHWRSPSMAVEFYFTPELHLRDGRVIRDLEDAISFAREQEARPGVDQRDEVLHRIERAESDEEAHAAAHSFVRWLEELDILDQPQSRALSANAPPTRASP
jgi:Transposase